MVLTQRTFRTNRWNSAFRPGKTSSGTSTSCADTHLTTSPSGGGGVSSSGTMNDSNQSGVRILAKARSGRGVGRGGIGLLPNLPSSLVAVPFETGGRTGGGSPSNTNVSGHTFLTSNLGANPSNSFGNPKLANKVPLAVSSSPLGDAPSFMLRMFIERKTLGLGEGAGKVTSVGGSVSGRSFEADGEDSTRNSEGRAPR